MNHIELIFMDNAHFEIGNHLRTKIQSYNSIRFSKVLKVYGADLASQYQAAPLLEEAIARWDRATRSRVDAAGPRLKITAPE